MIYAIDFDGTLCINEYPNIGQPIYKTIIFCKERKAEGHKLILWTCRSGKYLDEAVAWCKEQGLIFDAVNENLPEMIELFDNDCRKVFADYYIDDKNLVLG
jgi:hypothetical protein